MFYIFQGSADRIPPELLQIAFIYVLNSTRRVKEPKQAHLSALEGAGRSITMKIWIHTFSRRMVKFLHRAQGRDHRILEEKYLG